MTIEAGNPPSALLTKNETICLLKARQQGYRPFQGYLAQPLQIGLPASEPVQGMEMARRHVIPSCTDCRGGTIG